MENGRDGRIWGAMTGSIEVFFSMALKHTPE